MVFDILIANCDRNPTNIQVDRPSEPRAFYLIDHERSLFYIFAGDGLKRLENAGSRLGVTDGDTSRDEWHCLVELCDNVEHFQKWVRRVEDIPDWLINEVCDNIRKLALTRKECDYVKEFLKRRRDNLGQLILNHKNRFPLIRPADWGLFV